MFKKYLQFNSSRYRLEEENKHFAISMKSGAKVLDAGCGDAPYRHLFKQQIYESADLASGDRSYDKDITYICDLKNIPVNDSTYDHIICNQVLEHISEPQLVIDELARVLKPGGTILFTAPLFYQEHEQPHDYFRYTKYAWNYLLPKSGLNTEKIEPLEGFFGLCGYFFEVMYYFLPKNISKAGGKAGFIGTIILHAVHPLLALLSIFFHRLEKRIKLPVDIGSKNYAVIAVKKH